MSMGRQVLVKVHADLMGQATDFLGVVEIPWYHRRGNGAPRRHRRSLGTLVKTFRVGSSAFFASSTDERLEAFACLPPVNQMVIV